MKLETRLKHYFRALHETARRGDAREESFYPALQAFLTDCAREQGHDGIHVTPNPRLTEGGNPDFRIWDGSQRIIGYVEAKQPGTDLRAVADSEQLERYRRTFPNLVLTDFCEFWLFREGKLIEKVRAGRSLVLTDLDSPPPAENVRELDGLLTTFFGFSLPRSFDAPSLARELARRTRFLDRTCSRSSRLSRRLRRGTCGASSRPSGSSCWRSVFRDVELHQTILDHLRIYRNRVAHEGHWSRDAETIVCELKCHVEALLGFHLSQGRHYADLEEATEFLDLGQHRRHLRRARKYFRN